MKSLLAALALLIPSLATAVELRAPEEVALDSQVTVEVVGSVDPKAFVSIVSPDTAEGDYGQYAYTQEAAVQVQAPDQAGDYELRLHGADAPYATLARRPIRVVMAQASLQAPDSQPIGTRFEVTWAGPSADREYITLVPADAADGEYALYEYASGDGQGSVTLTTPTTPGDYELRYMTGSKNRVLARRALRVGDEAASVTAPASVTMGARFEVSWTGPANDRNYLTVVEAGAQPKAYKDFEYTVSPTVQLLAPETPGNYEVRLLSADSSRVLAQATITVKPAQATLKAPASVEAASIFEAGWTGPDNERDYVAVTPVGKSMEYVEYTYTRRGNPTKLRAPAAPGDYEIHYLTGGGNHSLASQPLRVTPAAKPGSLRVLAAVGAGSGSAGAPGAGSDGQGAQATTVELILDASGSMLQRLGGERRIDIARRALDDLVQKQLPEDTRVALRVFGHRKPDACDTELLSPLAPLDRTALGATVRGIEARNLAKTPIGASLAAVASDLAGVEGPALVVLVTDGEETCDGDPAAEIAKLKASGIDVSLNIVGFAIDEYALEQQFRSWASQGGGAYFAATDAAGLASSIAQATQPAVFTVVLGEDEVASGVVGGKAVPLKPGRYTVRSAGKSWPVVIVAGEEAVLDLN